MFELDTWKKAEEIAAQSEVWRLKQHADYKPVEDTQKFLASLKDEKFAADTYKAISALMLISGAMQNRADELACLQTISILSAFVQIREVVEARFKTLDPAFVNKAVKIIEKGFKAGNKN